MRVFLLMAAALVGSAAIASGQARADDIPYPCCGYNATTYTFYASGTGDVIAYFAGSTAGFDNRLGLLVNGVSTGFGYGLDNHSSTVGDSFDLGPAHQGDVLTFVLDNISLGKFAYSDPSMNLSYDNGPARGTSDGHNHVYATTYTATSPVLDHIPSGTFVAFEDLPFPGSDYNYNDETFVFPGAQTTPPPPAAPEPGAWAMLLLGMAGLGGALRSVRRQPA